MNDPQRPHNSTLERSERTNPEMGSDRDALNLVRKRRPMGAPLKKSSEKFQLTMPIKIGAVALIFAGIVLSVWTMKSAHTPVNDEDLPVIASELEMDDFKVAPSEKDDGQVPHSDKEFYSELEPAKPIAQKEAFRKAPERPSKQVSPETLFAKGAAAVKEEVPTKATKEVSDGDVKVVDNANDSAKQAYKAPAPTVSASKPRKTLEMAIQDTQSEMRRNANRLARNDNLSKNDVKKVVSAPVSVPTKASTSVKAAGGQGYWVQVASLPTQASAQKEAKRLQAKSKKELKSQDYRTVRVDLGKPKGIRYRVHFGPFSRSQAVQKCQNLKGNEKISCLVVKG